jgi:hypothetical protein
LYDYDEKVPDEYIGMPVTTKNNINTLFGFSERFAARRLTIQDIEWRAKDKSLRNAYPKFSSFLEHLKT